MSERDDSRPERLPIPRLNRDRSDWRGELADPGEAERLQETAPEAHLRRRDFLARTAMLAGAAGMASVLPIETLISEAAKRQAAKPYPSPRNMPIDTFVVLMMENRSFDHYFGWHDGADGKNAGLTFPDADDQPISTHHLPPDYQGCGHPDPSHGWGSGRYQYNEGRMNNFVHGNEDRDGSDEFAIGYYLEEDIPFIPHAAEAFQLYDRWFCSIMASTYPNRHFQLSAQNGGQKGNLFPPEVPGQETGFTWETILDRAQSRGVSVAYYVSDLPFPLLYGARANAWIRPIDRFYADAAAGLLPQICFVDPPFRDGGGGDGLSADEHPHGDIRLGQAFVSEVTNAFVQSPQYARGAMFINYDEWGGFFDHVRPPRVPDERANRKDLENDWGFCGFRIPGMAISPFTRGGGVSHMTVTHESILKLISYRFGLGYLTTRHRYASDIGRSFDFSKTDTTPPELPGPETVVTTACSAKERGAPRSGGVPFPKSFEPVPGTAAAERTGAEEPAPPPRPAPHHLDGIESTGWAEKLGYEVQPARLDRIFRNPDSIAKGLRATGRT